MATETQNKVEAGTQEKGRSLPAGYVIALVAAALLAGLVLRFVGFSEPPYDKHNFRQCQTLSTIDAFYRQGIDLLRPTTLCTGYPGAMALELPLFQAVGALLYHMFGPRLEIIRLLNILFGAAAAWVLYRLTSLLLDRTTAILSALIYWLAPLNILFQRSMLLDPMAVLCGLLSFYCLALLLEVATPLEPGRETSQKPLCWCAFATAVWLTAMIKALYLWPSVLLLFYGIWRRRFKPDRQLLSIFAAFAFSAICLFAWNHHATAINRANPFIPGWKLSTHLGFSSLFTRDFYVVMLQRAPKWWLGVALILYPIGLWACWAGRAHRHRAAILALLILIPPTYLVAFANINAPHEYYQLIITPFLSIVAACGARWLARTRPDSPGSGAFGSPAAIIAAGAVFVVASILVYSLWFRWPPVDRRVERFGELCAGKFDPWAPSMLFVATSVGGISTGDYVPAYQYAAKLWGYGRTVENAASARTQFDQLFPAFPRLDYVVFYGTDRADWLPADQFQPIIQDDARHLYAFKRVAANSAADGRR